MSFRTDLDVAGRRVVVCGGGPAALGPIRGLLDSGAEVTVVAVDLTDSIADLARRGLVTAVAADPAAADLVGAALVVPVTGRSTTDAEIRARARAAGVLALAADATAPRTRTGVGRVTLVGGGPGDPGLLTVAGLEAIRRADVIICDRLAPLAVLSQARSDAEIVDVAKIPRGAYTSQERINALLVEHATAGADVVRFKGGDNFIFGRGGEEWQACAAAGIEVTVIPGVSSATAGPALAGIPLTHRQLTQGFTVVSGHAAPGDPASTLDWAALARANTTLVVLMGLATLPAITATLVAEGLDPVTPALTIADAGLPSQRVVGGTVADIAARTADAGFTPPAVTVIGAVAGFDPHQP